jgi:hypothetical protein
MAGFPYWLESTGGGGGGGGPVDPGPAWVDLDERQLDGATIVDVDGTDHVTIWPNQGTLGSAGDAIIDPDDGSTDAQGFIVGEDGGRSTLTAVYAGGDGALDSRMSVRMDLGDEFTIFTLRKVGADAPVDLTEMCPLSFDPAGGQYFTDQDIDGVDRASSYVIPFTDDDAPRIFGGPLVGDAIIETQVLRQSDAEPSLGHVDGYEAVDAQTLYYAAPGAAFAATGVMLANYPEGGYCAPGPWRRVLIYDRALTQAERLFVRQMLRDQAAEAGDTVTLYDETPLAWGVDPDRTDDPGTLTPGEFTVDDLPWIERWDAEDIVFSSGSAVEWPGAINGITLSADTGIAESATVTPTGKASVSLVVPIHGGGFFSPSDVVSPAAWADIVNTGATLCVVARIVWDGDDGAIFFNRTGAGPSTDSFGGVPRAGADGSSLISLTAPANDWAVLVFAYDADRQMFVINDTEGFASPGHLEDFIRPQIGGQHDNFSAAEGDYSMAGVLPGRYVMDDVRAIRDQIATEWIG